MMAEVTVNEPLVEQESGVTGKYLDPRSVDMTAVKDLRKAIRRKFASRSNLDKVFGQWDLGNKGEITAIDLLNGIKKLGINANLEQASVLLNSAQKVDDEGGKISKQEFGELLFNSDEGFNVNCN